mgnify:CR=1 FL=1
MPKEAFENPMDDINERQKQLLNQLRENRFLTIPELAQRLYASVATIRRDLKKLESMNLAKITQGNACLVQKADDLPLNMFKKTNIEEKKEIAQKAVKLINEKDVLFLDASATVSTILEYLSSFKNLTIFTNGLETALKATNLGFETVLIGGRIRAISSCCYGSLAEAMMQLVHFNTTFFSAPGLSSSGELTHYSPDQISLIQTAIRRSASSYFLCVSPKLGKTYTYHLCNADEITGIIHNEDPELPFPSFFPQIDK